MNNELGPLDHLFAKRLLKKSYSEEKALFLSTLMRHARDGHLCWRPSKAPELPPSILEEGASLLPEAPVVREHGRYYLQRNWVYETHILQQIQRLLQRKFPISAPLHDPSLLPSQQKAIAAALQTSFSVISGGPGTGKTYTAAHLARTLAQSKRCKIALAAPTGKAAAHLQTVLGPLEAQVEATTLHRLLRIRPGETRLFSHRKIDADLILVDEASMVDVPLLAQLLESIGNESRLVLMGDPDQLPPIEASTLFREIASLMGTPLSAPMRTENSQLLQLAQSIQRGELQDPPLLDWSFDSSLIQKLFAALNPRISWEEPDPSLCLKELDRFRILGSLRQGPFGTEALNRQIVEEIGRQIRPGQWWVLPILITANHPDQDLYNGTCGVLIGRSEGGVDLRKGNAYFPKKVLYSALPPFEIAFCLSIHKSQGSEFERVLVLFPEGSDHFGKAALYTAVTRAKKGVEIVAEDSILRGLLSRPSQSDSGFTERFLKGELP